MPCIFCRVPPETALALAEGRAHVPAELHKLRDILDFLPDRVRGGPTSPAF